MACLEPELPAGLVQLVQGGVDAGVALVGHAGVGAISFTGSVAAGASVARQAVDRGLPAQCEMGGQNASIVLADADLGRAAATIARAAMGYAGQKCTATSRVIAERGVAADLRDALVAEVDGPASSRIRPTTRAGRAADLGDARAAAVAAVERGVAGGRAAARRRSRDRGRRQLPGPGARRGLRPGRRAGPGGGVRAGRRRSRGARRRARRRAHERRPLRPRRRRSSRATSTACSTWPAGSTRASCA